MYIRTTGIVALLALLWLPVFVSAQPLSVPGTPVPDSEMKIEEPESSPVTEAYEAELVTLGKAFWGPRMNSYKVEIDRMFSASDLVRLNELRARAAVLRERIETIRQRHEGYDWMYRQQADTRSNATASITRNSAASVDTAVRYSDPGAEAHAEAMATLEDYHDDDDDDGDFYPDQMTPEEIEQSRGIIETQLGANITLLDLLATNGEAMLAELMADRNHPYDRQRYNEDALELTRLSREQSDLTHICNWIARNYRPGMEALLARNSADLKEFHEAVRLHARDFVRARGTKVLEEPFLSGTMIQTLSAVKQSVEMLDTRDSTLAEATLAIREITTNLMLHDGQDRAAISMIDNSAADAKRSDDGATLGQNSPNPASTRTTIPYTLSEPGTTVVLKILDTRGALVATYQQGARPAGEHALSIDVSALAPGTYLYQLAVTTEAGERVFSKGFQVVR